MTKIEYWMDKTEERLTTKEIADRFGVNKKVVSNWLLRGKFPNAIKSTDRHGVEFWEVPESDLTGFEPQRRTGRPSVKSPSKETEAKRQSREKIREQK